MGLEIIVSLAVGAWIVVTLLVVSLCRAAKWSDNAMDTAWAREVHTSRDHEPAPSPTTRRPLRTLDLDHAAILLGVRTETLLAWEARFGFPKSSPSECRYNELEVLALRESLSQGVSISAAVAQARERTKRRRPPAGPRMADQRDGGGAS